MLQFFCSVGLRTDFVLTSHCTDVTSGDYSVRLERNSITLQVPPSHVTRQFFFTFAWRCVRAVCNRTDSNFKTLCIECKRQFPSQIFKLLSQSRGKKLNICSLTARPSKSKRLASVKSTSFTCSCRTICTEIWRKNTLKKWSVCLTDLFKVVNTQKIKTQMNDKCFTHRCATH